jgi:uncharacterized protein (DUF1697 family)
VRTHVALLRAVNVGGRNRVPMADLRAIVTSLGHGDVATHVQSGNVVLRSAEDADPEVLATQLEQALADGIEVRTDVVVLTRDELAGVVAANPFPEEGDPKKLHVLFQRGSIEGAEDALADAVARARAKGSRDDVRVVDGVLYLHTPDGLGRSELAGQLARRAVAALLGGPGTMRNWATVTRLLAMLDEAPATSDEG